VVSRSIALDQCSLARVTYFTGMPNDESGAKVNPMVPVAGVSGSTPVPPPVVSSAAWPREGSVLAFIAANCGQCERNEACDITDVPAEPCQNLPDAASKKPA
jgi:hypothetical protein